VNIPLGRILVAHRLEGKFDKDTAIVMVCRTGVRSARAAARAAELGFTNVVSLDGGMAAWNDAGLEIKRAKAQAKPAIQFELIGLPCS
ncbi:MAG: rhodanese-like domain-containing protein, partial [SAR324 cluster bacterium]|nr:rhodanese-like domain-containing protein [SAR324 cluster bacterium]